MTIDAATELFTGTDWESPLSEDLIGRLPAVKGLRASASAVATTPSSVTMTVQGTAQGKFAGDSGRREDAQIAAQFVTYSVVSPREAGAGVATGKRQHAPLVVRQVPNPSTVQFFQAMVRNELLSTVAIDFGGVLKVTLQGAFVSGVRLIGEGAATLIELAFVFQDISIDHPRSTRSASDSWGPAR